MHLSLSPPPPPERLLFTIGGVLMGIAISDFRFTASLGLIMGLLLWVLIRGIDWIIRGFKFGG